MSRYKMFLLRSTALALATMMATASFAQKEQSYDPMPPPEDISQGDILVLLKPLEIPSGRNALDFQDGRVVEKSEINDRIPICRLELNTQTRIKLTLEPQRFIIANVSYDERASSHAGEVLAVTSIEVKAAKDGKVKGISCSRPRASEEPEFISAEQISDTLSGFFSFETPD